MGGVNHEDEDQEKYGCRLRQHGDEINMGTWESNTNNNIINKNKDKTNIIKV